MKKFLLWVCVVSNTSLLWAASATFKGRILDSNRTPVAFATITLSAEGNIIRGTVSDSLGCFAFEKVPQGPYSIEFSYVGFETFSKAIDITEDNAVHDFVFATTVVDIGTVMVLGKMPTIRRSDDGFVVNMANSPIVQNKNVLQSLNYTPGVIVTPGKKITLNGKQGVVVMLNGRKINMGETEIVSFLENLRGEDVASIKVIADAGARYDAEGQGGVIDVVLKKSAYQGLSGSVYGNLDQGHYLSGALGASLNYNVKKFTIYGTAGYGRSNNYSSEDETLEHAASGVSKNSAMHSKSLDNKINYRAGVQYAINPKHNLGFEVYGNSTIGHANGNSQVAIRSADADSTTMLTNNAKNNNKTISYNLNYTFNINPNGERLSLIADYTAVDNQNNIGYNYYTVGGVGAPNAAWDKLNFSRNRYGIKTSQLDYTLPFAEKFDFSAGVKYAHTNTQMNAQLDSRVGAAPYATEPDYTYRYGYVEQIAAGYFTFGYKSAKFEGKVGLRGEYNSRQSALLSKEKIDLFPTVTLKYNVSKEYYISAYYGRRVNRAPFTAMLPYYYFVTPYSINVGNPDIVPSIVDAISLNTGYKQYALSASYSIINDNISYIANYDPTTAISRNQYVNIKNGKMLTVGFVCSIPITKWWSSYNNIIYKYSQYDDLTHGIHTRNNSIMWRSNNEFSLPGGVDLAVSVTGMSQSLAAGVRTQNGGFMFDAALSKDFFDNKFNVTVSMSDITGLLNRLSENAAYDGFVMHSRSFTNAQVASISLNYRFNKGKKFQNRTNNSANWDESLRIK